MTRTRVVENKAIGVFNLIRNGDGDETFAWNAGSIFKLVGGVAHPLHHVLRTASPDKPIATDSKTLCLHCP